MPATTHGVRSPGAGAAGRPAGPATELPHAEQNRAEAVRGTPQDGHRVSPREAPQAEQKLPLPAAPQAAQVVTDASGIGAI
jgi:hypothetical protein